MVDRGGLENRCTCKRTVGSNPTLSAILPPCCRNGWETPEIKGLRSGSATRRRHTRRRADGQSARSFSAGDVRQFRVRVPDRLRKTIGKGEIVESLGAVSRAEGARVILVTPGEERAGENAANRGKSRGEPALDGRTILLDLGGPSLVVAPVRKMNPLGFRIRRPAGSAHRRIRFSFPRWSYP